MYRFEIDVEGRRQVERNKFIKWIQGGNEVEEVQEMQEVQEVQEMGEMTEKDEKENEIFLKTTAAAAAAAPDHPDDSAPRPPLPHNVMDAEVNDLLTGLEAKLQLLESKKY